MYKISVSSHFDAAHHIPDYEGRCSQNHGHRWVVVCDCRVRELDKLGMSIDFTKIKSQLNELIDLEFDHQDLNTVLERPTAENIAKHIYWYLKPNLSGLHSVTVYESPDCGVEYWGD